MRLSLFAKLLFAFALVALAGIALTAMLANRSAGIGLNLVQSRGSELQTKAIAPVLASYYAQQGSWGGVGDFLAQTTAMHTPAGGQQGQGRGRATASEGGIWWLANHRLIIADSHGEVMYDSGEEMAGQSLSGSMLTSAEPLLVDDGRIGYLLLAQSGANALEQEFFERVNQGLLLGALTSGALALLAAAVLARRLTSPIHRLTTAAHGIAQGDLNRSVAITSHDEVGELADAFNQMAYQLSLSEAQRRELLADIAHELRNPLSAMQGNLEGLLDGVLPLGPEQVATVYNQTLLLSRLVDDLRLLSLTQVGQLPLERSPTDMGTLVYGVVDNFRPLAQERGVALEVDIADGLPPISADPQRISQVVANLLSNALRYTTAEGQVMVTVQRSERGIEVSVADTGPGISEQDLPHVFERFYRVDKSRSRGQGGSGLGLAIAKELVEAHGGNTRAESKPGEGSRFTFFLPA